jgi:hypothetical protein
MVRTINLAAEAVRKIKHYFKGKKKIQKKCHTGVYVCRTEQQPGEQREDEQGRHKCNDGCGATNERFIERC